ncbi:MAG: hypothetical protein RL477_33, partial [Pseudomonadota bacterium]
DRHLLEGVVLTGAGAMLPGMWDMAERKLDCPAIHGMAKGIGDWPEELNGAAWTTAAGLSMYSAKLKLQRAPQRRPGGLMGLLTQ